jgi:CBS domain-containing protein
MLAKNAKSFLKKYPPFSRLDDHALAQLARRLTMELYPAGTHIMKQGDTSSGSLHIIKEGSVRIYARTMQGQENVIDFRGKGDTFGPFPLEGDRPLGISVQAVSDAVCYVADRASVVKLLDEHPALSEYLMPLYFPKGDGRGARVAPAAGVLHDRSENALFATPVRELANRDVVTARTSVSILDAVRSMSVHSTGALVIVDEADNPVGMLTVTDLRDRVLAPQKSLLDPVSDIMSTPIVRVDGTDLCFEALLKMMSHEVHHLLVMDAGSLIGIVSNHDFMVLQVSSPLMIVRDIESQSSVEGLASSSGKVTTLISMLLSEGAKAGSINRIITSVNDRIERKILDLTLKTLGPPPVPFCWIVYGSAGRKEQTFITDQDNGLIYTDPRNEEEAREAKAYFSRLAEFSVNAFLRCGFALCPGEFMATNPKWCQPFSVWKRHFSDWIDTPADEALHSSVNLFDFRGLHGDLRLAVELKKHLMDKLGDQNLFLKAVADLTTDYRPPIGLFGSLTVAKDGVHANQLDLKKNCLTPLTNIIRLFSFECRIYETSTVERLSVLRTVHPIVKTLGDDLAYALEFLSMLRIRNQLEQVSAGLAPDNFINPKRLSSLEQRNLKEICRLLSRILDDIEKKYGIGTQL